MSLLWVWTESVLALERPNSYHFKHIPHCFASRRVFTCGCIYFQLPTKSHKPKSNIKSQLLICLLSTAPFPFIRSPCLRSFWHLRGVFFEVRVSQTILITPVAHFSHAGLDGGKELKLWLCIISGALKQWYLWNKGCGEQRDGAMYQILIDFMITSVFLIVHCHLMMKVQSFTHTPAHTHTHTHPFIIIQSHWVNKAALKCISTLDKSNQWH